MRGAALAILLSLPVAGAMEGVVQNGTTGREQAGVEVTLMKLEQGMQPIGSTKTDAAGKFRFEQEPGGAPVMLQAQFEGVTYNQMIPPGTRTGDTRLTVYRAAPATTSEARPEQHVMLLEPSGREMIINESFLYRNQSQPPVTYVDRKRGVLRFYLTPGAKGIVQVSTTGPGGVPVRSAAEKTEQPDVYKVDFAVKPGESRIDLTYLTPYQSGMDFVSRKMYPGLVSRVAVPGGVAVKGEGLQSMGEEPQTKATIFQMPAGETFRLAISGEGRLSRAGQEGAGGEASISIVPAPIDSKFWLIIGLAAAILGLGFYGLFTAQQDKPPEGGKAKRR